MRPPNRLDALFRPGRIGSLELANRLVMAPMVTSFAERDTGAVSARMVDYYARRARGGAGMIIVEATAPLQEGRITRAQLGAWDDQHVPGLRRLAQAIQAHGARAVLQIQHAGRQTREAVTDAPPVSSSEVYFPFYQVRPLPLSRSAIAERVDAFAEAARRAKEAGFDGIEIQGAHGYLIEQFLSPLTNLRDDDYGGSLENRMRFACEVLRRSRERVGDFPILWRLSADERMPGGLGLEEMREVALRLVEAGVDALDVSMAVYESFVHMVPTMACPEGVNVYAAQALRSAVGVPVIATGRITDPAYADAVLQRGEADFIGLGRALLVDPDLPRKAREGEPYRTCLSCNQGCISQLLLKEPITCTQNPLLGHEGEGRPAPSAARVMVVGGGPAGLEAALDAAEAGHEVELYEQAWELGGQVNLAGTPAASRNWLHVVRDRARALREAPVALHLGVRVDRTLVDARRPDIVVVATGALPRRPDWAGPEFVPVEALLSGLKEAGPRVAIVGGGMVGLTGADWLSEMGREVTLIEAGSELAPDMEPVSRYFLLQRLDARGVIIRLGCRATGVRDGDLMITGPHGTERIGAETLAYAVGRSPENRLVRELAGCPGEIRVIGDARQPRTVLAATREGAEAVLGRELGPWT